MYIPQNTPKLSNIDVGESVIKNIITPYRTYWLIPPHLCYLIPKNIERKYIGLIPKSSAGSKRYVGIFIESHNNYLPFLNNPKIEVDVRYEKFLEDAQWRRVNDIVDWHPDLEKNYVKN